jgi:hypothetical protein
VEPGFFSLDEELQLVPGMLTPLMHAHVVRFGAWLPFQHAAKEMALNHKVTLSKEQARRKTEQAGAVYEQEQTQAPSVAELAAQCPAHAEIINDTLGYFTKRRDQIDYPAFKAAAWPIGSGAGEAAHKVVVEARLKQAGMRWATDNVNPMVALRNLICNDRWDEGWPAVVSQLRHPLHPSASTAPVRDQVPTGTLPSGFSLKSATPWRNMPVGKAQLLPSSSYAKS